MSNTKPLWKQLNEERTQGNWQSVTFKDDDICIKESDLFKNGKWQFSDRIFTCGNYTSKNEANAQYTALAVNNFASVVEALESMLNFFGGDNWEHGRKKSIAQAKEALNNIS